MFWRTISHALPTLHLQHYWRIYGTSRAFTVLPPPHAAHAHTLHGGYADCAAYKLRAYAPFRPACFSCLNSTAAAFIAPVQTLGSVNSWTSLFSICGPIPAKLNGWLAQAAGGRNAPYLPGEEHMDALLADSRLATMPGGVPVPTHR